MANIVDNLSAGVYSVQCGIEQLAAQVEVYMSKED